MAAGSKGVNSYLARVGNTATRGDHGTSSTLAAGGLGSDSGDEEDRTQ